MPITNTHYTATHEARRIPDYLTLAIAPISLRYESAKVFLAEAATWEQPASAYTLEIQTRARQEIADFEAHHAGEHYQIRDIWDYPGMPLQSMVTDFYQTAGFTWLQQQQALWERISEETMDQGEPVNRYGKPFAQWRVTLPASSHTSETWMIYQIWTGAAKNQAAYIYISCPTDWQPGAPDQPGTIYTRLTLQPDGEEIVQHLQALKQHRAASYREVNRLEDEMVLYQRVQYETAPRANYRYKRGDGSEITVEAAILETKGSAKRIRYQIPVGLQRRGEEDAYIVWLRTPEELARLSEREA